MCPTTFPNPKVKKKKVKQVIWICCLDCFCRVHSRSVALWLIHLICVMHHLQVKRSRSHKSNKIFVVDVDGTILDVEATFCYLGDMLCSSGGCDSAIVARCSVAWGKFRKLLPVLTSRHLSPRIRGKVYEVCVRSAMLHGSQMWGPKEPVLRWLHRNDHTMIRWICGIKDRDETPSVSLLQKLGIEDITSVSDSDGMAMYNRPSPVSNLSQTFRFLAQERKEDLKFVPKGPFTHDFSKWVSD